MEVVEAGREGEREGLWVEGGREGRIKGVIREGGRDCGEEEMEEERGGIAGGGEQGRRLEGRKGLLKAGKQEMEVLPE